jgi:hypothetical protein
MKTFVDYLTESEKVYSFKVGVAGELPEGFENTLETALKKFGVKNMTPGKKTPIQERPLDFPQLENVDVTYYEVDLHYPTTNHVLQEYVGQCCGISQSHVIVRNPNEPQELYQQEEDKAEYTAMLTQEDMGGESAQQDAGTSRVMELLKDLESARKDRDNNYVGDVPAGESKDIDDNENSKAVLS